MPPHALLTIAFATCTGALTVPILSLDHGPLPLDILSLDELPEVTLRQLKLESGGGPRLLGLLDGEPAVGARGVLCHVEEHGDDGHRALAFSRFEVADQPSLGGGPTRLAVGDVAPVTDVEAEDDPVLRDSHDLLQRRHALAADELRVHLAYGRMEQLVALCDERLAPSAAAVDSISVKRFAPGAAETLAAASPELLAPFACDRRELYSFAVLRAVGLSRGEARARSPASTSERPRRGAAPGDDEPVARDAHGPRRPRRPARRPLGADLRRRRRRRRPLLRLFAAPLGIFRRREQVLFLISDTGGGHRASADALVEALGRCAPDVATEVCDLLTDVAPFPYNAAVPLYKFLAARPWLWRLVWYGTALVDRVISDGAPWPGCAAPFEAKLRAAAADVVVSVHPMLQAGPLDALEALAAETGRATPFATLRDAALDKAAPHRVVTHGLPIRRAFCDGGLAKGDAREARPALDKKTVLVMGGGDGFGALKATALAVRAACADATVVVACGRNAALKAELETVENMIALGFTKAIDEWMAASDLLLTKAGPGTIAEAAALGLPVLLTGYLPGQEFGNVSYRQAGFDPRADLAAMAKGA
ncbi:1,2-diacylglycerol 3-beta-galactosyltransferase [Aureococcus anophagefferens]|nr:1,2-diacylglycerol 3-beta-galactosyltransferase [Aureococcus anophagefferens]